MYDLGEGGLTQDSVEAVKWYTMAANQRYALGKCKLAGMYYAGTGVTQDYYLAYVWYSRCATTAEKDSSILRLDTLTRVQGAYLLRDESAKHLSSEQLSKAQQEAWN
jgi:TPR repeat protein